MSNLFFWGEGGWGIERLTVLCDDDLGIIRLIFSIGELRGRWLMWLLLRV